MKNRIYFALSIFLGVIIGFFGVFASVFADGAIKERLLTIAVILLIYLIFGFFFGFLLPRYSWKAGISIGIPGFFLLLLYMLREYNFYYFVYMAMIILFSSLGGWLGSFASKRKSDINF